MSDLVWYAGYGSNLSPDRFSHYLGGGRPEGATRDYPGARDRTPPREVRALTLRGSVSFAWESPTWGGGIAFYAPEPADDVARLTGYLLTRAQLLDVVEQEMWRPPGADTDLAGLLDGDGRVELGPGRYETLLRIGRVGGRAVVTCTCPDPVALGLRAPAAAYVQTMARGLLEVHGLSAEQVVDYLAGRPGIGSWTASGLGVLVAGVRSRASRSAPSTSATPTRPSSQ